MAVVQVMAQGPRSFVLRTAQREDIPELNAMIERSARTLSVGYYSPLQIESAIRHVFGVDTRLIEDQTYYVVMDETHIVACGGWSKRRTLYGGDQRPVGGVDWLDPHSDPAKIRAFFVAPEYARQGIGRMLLTTCVDEAKKAGFTTLELMATLPGVPFYAALGFENVTPVTDKLPDGTSIEFILMKRNH